MRFLCQRQAADPRFASMRQFLMYKKEILSGKFFSPFRGRANADQSRQQAWGKETVRVPAWVFAEYGAMSGEGRSAAVLMSRPSRLCEFPAGGT
jgi:hypothetical protein